MLTTPLLRYASPAPPSCMEPAACALCDTLSKRRAGREAPSTRCTRLAGALTPDAAGAVGRAEAAENFAKDASRNQRSAAGASPEASIDEDVEVVVGVRVAGGP